MLSVIALGVGAGASSVYDGEASSAFLLLDSDGEPLLLLDAGLGATAAALRHCGRLPRHIYISHNHTDHAGELPVILAVESARRTATATTGSTSTRGTAPAPPPPALTTVLAERAVMRRLREHRLHELLSTGRPLDTFAHFVELQEGVRTELGGGAAAAAGARLAVTPLRAQHAEVAFGLLIERDGAPVLGWTADSGCCERLLARLAAAPAVLVDARAQGSAEHAGFDEVAAACSGSGALRGRSVYVYGYGCVGQAPSIRTHPALCAVAKVLRPGDKVVLGGRPVGGSSAADGGGEVEAGERELVGAGVRW